MAYPTPLAPNVEAPPPLSFQPLCHLLTQKYQGNKDQLVAELYQLSNYLMREPDQQDDSAAKLRQRFNLITDLAAALDEA